MDIAALLEKAKHGELPACTKCSWSPKALGTVAFGVTCIEHGLDWTQSNNAISMVIVQDPGDTTPQYTGMLCAVHNSKHSSDKTALYALELWKAAVSLDSSSVESDTYMKHNYWTNAIMHGASGKSHFRDKNIQQQARKACSSVLKDQIICLDPKVIIATGKDAVSSMYEIGLISKEWKELRHSFDSGAYRNVVIGWNGIPHKITIFCTYHTAARVVNQTLSRLYKKDITENFLLNKLKQIPTKNSVIHFLEKYDDVENNAIARGMRYLLNHWLDIGFDIRRETVSEAKGQEITNTELQRITRQSVISNPVGNGPAHDLIYHAVAKKALSISEIFDAVGDRLKSIKPLLRIKHVVPELVRAGKIRRTEDGKYIAI